MCINMKNEHPGPDTKTDTELGKVSGPRAHAPVQTQKDIIKPME